MASATFGPGAPPAWLRRVVDVRPGEVRALVWAFLYFFFLLTSYYILRPLRDEMGIAGGVGKLPHLFTITFLIMLAVAPVWAAILSRWPRQRVLPVAYRFFVANVVILYLAFQWEPARLYAARAFFVWLSVFNLLGVSVFWSFMADAFGADQSKRLFGFIAAGGSAGALCGPLLTGALVGWLGPVNLFLISAVLLEAAARCIPRVMAGGGGAPPPGPAPPTSAAPAPRADGAAGRVTGGAFSGIGLVFRTPYLAGIAGYVLCATVTGTFAYLIQQNIVARLHMDPAERTALFANIDLVTNVTTLLLQMFATGRLFARAGLTLALASAAPLSAAAFGAVAVAPVIAVLVAVHVLRRAVGYALAEPARNALFTVVDDQQKYKSKMFIDTVVFRAGDVAGGWAYAGLGSLGLGIPGLALATMPLSLAWFAIAVYLARRHARLSAGVPR